MNDRKLGKPWDVNPAIDDIFQLNMRDRCGTFGVLEVDGLGSISLLLCYL